MISRIVIPSSASPGSSSAAAAQVPAASTQVVQTVTEPAPTVETFIRSLDSSRYRLIEKKGNKEVYLDTQTGKKWSVKVEREDD